MIKYTKQEEEALLAIEERYKPELEACMKELNNLDISEQREEWLEASNRFNDVNERIQAERNAYFKQAELRSFDSFKGDVGSIAEAVKSQIPSFIYISKVFAGDKPTKKERAEKQKRIEREKENLKKAIAHNEKLLEEFPDDQELIKNTNELKESNPEKILQFHYDTIYSEQALHERIKDSFAMYFEFLLKMDPKAYDELQIFIDKTIKARDNIKPSDIDTNELNEGELIPTIMTRYPEVYITPKDKISNYLFDGKLSENLEGLRTENVKSKKELTAVVSIDYDELNGVEIKGRREFNAYDREVHDSIISLYIDGGNEYITPQMIYRTMTGNPGAKLSDKQAEAISSSVTKCMFSKLTIDASREAAAWKMDKLKYEGNLIYAEKVMGMSKGEVLEWIHIIKPPILYQYADSKNQIGRLDIKLLNTPINKTEEVITLQGYLYRRILAMNGTMLSRNIVYDAIYKAIDVTAKTDGALRKKKNKVRDQVREMLDYWTENNFISGHTENKKGSSIYSVTIHTKTSR